MRRLVSLNPHHPTPTSVSWAGKLEKEIPAMWFVNGAGIFRQG
jgi:hypothetical protein